MTMDRDSWGRVTHLMQWTIKKQKRTEMIEIKPNCLYSRNDLGQMLARSGVDVDFFIARLKPRKIFRMLWLGTDILDALASAAPLSTKQQDAELPHAKNNGNRRRRETRGDPSTDPLEELLK